MSLIRIDLFTYARIQIIVKDYEEIDYVRIQKKKNYILLGEFFILFYYSLLIPQALWLLYKARIGDLIKICDYFSILSYWFNFLFFHSGLHCSSSLWCILRFIDAFLVGVINTPSFTDFRRLVGDALYSLILFLFKIISLPFCNTLLVVFFLFVVVVNCYGLQGHIAIIAVYVHSIFCDFWM